MQDMVESIQAWLLGGCRSLLCPCADIFSVSWDDTFTMFIFIRCRRHILGKFQANFSSVLLDNRGFESCFLWGILVIVHRNTGRSHVWCSKAHLGFLDISMSCNLQEGLFISIRWLCWCQKFEHLANAMTCGGNLLEVLRSHPLEFRVTYY
jgi:hypothetical protein